MGSGCSRMDNVRDRIRRNIVRTKTRKLQSNHVNAPPQEGKSEEDTVGAQEEDDELDVLSPVSDMNKLGSGGTRGLSAASTVLPGTSISFSPVMEGLSELESYKPLPDLEEFPEDIRHLLLGHCSANDPNERRRLRDIFLLVIANGTDGLRFFEEMETSLFSSLKSYCLENDAILNVYLFGHQPVPCGYDYREMIEQFISDLLKTETVITMTIFGRPETHVQPPEIIQQADFDAAVSRMSSVDNREFIHCVYAADVNAVKTCYRLQTAPTDNQEQTDMILKILEATFDTKSRDTYLTSVFEDILRVFGSDRDEVLESRSFLIHLESSSDTLGESRREALRVQHRLSEWENRIPDDLKLNFFNGDSWEELWNGDIPHRQEDGGPFSSLELRLRQLLGAIFETYTNERKYFTKVAGKGIDWQLRDELHHQQSEIRNHLHAFRDRPDLLSSVMNYIAGAHPHPLIIHGRQGRGKSALLSVASVLCGAVFPAMPVIMRSAGASPESLTQEQILRSVCEQLAILYGEHPSIACRSIAEHNTFFATLLRRACAERPLVILLDGLDQVEEHSGRSLKWFPTVLPQHVKIILALRDGSSELLELQERLSGEVSAFLEIPDLDVDEALSIVEHQLRLKGRRLTETQQSFGRICVMDNSYPRYAQLFAHVARKWHNLSIPEHFWVRHSLYDIVCDYLRRMCNAVDKREMNTLLATINTLKHGMMESEMWDVLQSVSDIIGSSSTKCCPLSLIYLKHHFDPLLRTSFRSGHKFTQFRNQLFRRLCRTYVGKELLKDCLQRTLEYFSDDEEESLSNSRKVRNVIKTNHKHQRWRHLEEITHLRIKLNESVRKDFFSHRWLQERVLNGDVYLLLEEIKMYKRLNPDDREIDVLRKFLQLSSYALRLDGRQLYTQFHGRARGCFSDQESIVKYPNLRKIVRARASPPVLSFHTSGPCLRTFADVQRVFPTPKTKDFLERISWMSNDTKYIVTYSSTAGEVTLWNAEHTKKLVVVKEEECVVGLKSLGRNAEILLLHHNTMAVLDLAKSLVKTRMTELIDVTQGVSVLDNGKSILAVSERHDEILRFDTYSGHVGGRIFSGENRTQ